MQGLLQDIKNKEFKPVYLLFGQEAYLRKQYRDRLRDALNGADDTMNTHYYEGKDISVGEVIDLAETLPFLAEYRVIILENSGLFKKGGEKLAEYLSEQSETTVLILVETEVDKRSKLYKAIQSKGRAAEFKEQDENTLQRWILGILKKEGKTISRNGLQYFLNKTGTDMEHIRMELEKLICFTLGREEITEADIEAVCIKRVQNQIFEMINALADKNQKKALELYYDLLTLREPPMRILALIGRQFNLLLQVRELKQKGYASRQISEKTGLHGFVVGKYEKQAGRFKVTELKSALEACVTADEMVKTGKMTDTMSVELLIVQYSH